MLATVRIDAFGKEIVFRLGMDKLHLQLELVESMANLLRALDRRVTLDGSIGETSKSKSTERINETLDRLSSLKKTAITKANKKPTKKLGGTTSLVQIREEVKKSSDIGSDDDFDELDERPMSPQLNGEEEHSISPAASASVEQAEPVMGPNPSPLQTEHAQEEHSISPAASASVEHPSPMQTEHAQVPCSAHHLPSSNTLTQLLPKTLAQSTRASPSEQAVSKSWWKMPSLILRAKKVHPNASEATQVHPNASEATQDISSFTSILAS
jgi:hypothetical protein